MEQGFLGLAGARNFHCAQTTEINLIIRTIIITDQLVSIIVIIIIISIILGYN